MVLYIANLSDQLQEGLDVGRAGGARRRPSSCGGDLGLSFPSKGTANPGSWPAYLKREEGARQKARALPPAEASSTRAGAPGPRSRPSRQR